MKFDKKQRTKLRKRLKEIYTHHDGKTVAEMLTSEGFTTPAGEAITEKKLYTYARTLGVRKRGATKSKSVKKHYAVIPPKLRDDRADLLDVIINARGISKQSKLRAIEGLL